VSITLPSTSPDLTKRSDLIHQFVDGQYVLAVSVVDDPEGPGQTVDLAAKTITHLTTHFSPPEGALGDPALESGNFEDFSGEPGTTVLRPFETSICPSVKPRTAPINTITIHWTDPGAPKDGEPSFTAYVASARRGGPQGPDKKPKCVFASYYISERGLVVQVADDALQTSHVYQHNTGNIGIELQGDTMTPEMLAALKKLTSVLLSKPYVQVGTEVKRHSEFTQQINCAAWDSYKTGDGKPKFTSSDDCGKYKTEHDDPHPARMSDAQWSELLTFLSSPPPSSADLTVTVNPSGGGLVTGPGISCPGDCTETYSAWTGVSLSAAPAPGFYFKGWSGACSGRGPCALSMDSDSVAVAHFSNTLTWSVSISWHSGSAGGSCAPTFTLPVSGGSQSFGCGGAAVTFSTSTTTMSVSGFGSVQGCSGSGGGSSGITDTPDAFSGGGSISGSSTCTDDDGTIETYPVTGTFSASAPKESP
jgi:hypothetical protein